MLRNNIFLGKNYVIILYIINNLFKFVFIHYIYHYHE